ncbi:MAG: MoaD/ThiS family protein [Deltaproteobacteria bacterium]|jgi:hypothetical protein|nr:MoaD/ThiS family protein [Deltaproteobacteria bacterium]MBT4266466.1 MoaD/ThiS family protein [Deltaproteobacteria bacterium]MBT4644144.1 MoaD/ThiS family protein [Deltaproteobacteria bacterium]MBT6502798.1 MoaD/ThiS family protein [Deltaproteobacteria bacterium]MBT7155355.1 MoaD/ThiS family protein [Deltaproteobacteria bacterium]
MEYRLHAPFARKKTRDRLSWEVIKESAEMSVAVSLEHLVVQHLEMADYVRQSVEETFHHLLLFRADHVLGADEKILPQDRIEIIMPLTGG